MINEKDIIALPKASRTSFLTSSVTAAQAQVTALSPTGPTAGAYNDAVLELHRLNYFLTSAQGSKS